MAPPKNLIGRPPNRAVYVLSGPAVISVTTQSLRPRPSSTEAGLRVAGRHDRGRRPMRDAVLIVALVIAITLAALLASWLARWFSERGRLPG